MRKLKQKIRSNQSLSNKAPNILNQRTKTRYIKSIVRNLYLFQSDQKKIQRQNQNKQKFQTSNL